MNLRNEPVMVIGALEAAVIAVLGVVAYIFEWDAELTALVLTAASAIVILVGAFIARSKVTPVEDA